MPTMTLAATMHTWIEEVTGSQVATAVRQAGGGRKEGWLIELEPDGGRLFLRWDRSDPTVTGDPWTVRREAAIYRALSGRGVPVAGFVALHPTEEALLLEVVDGDGRFSLVRDEATATAIAQDFMARLADIHALDVVELGLAPPDRTVGECVVEQLDEMEALISFRGGVPTAELAVALRWLRANVPAFDGRPVLVQGDTGPGNFMFRGDRVAAIVDWELAHVGDAMDDLAWVSLRSTQEPFPDLPERFQEYASASGTPVDLERIRYYRVLAEAKIATMGHRRGKNDGASDDDPREDGDGGDIGARLIFGQLHRRLLVESLADAMSVEIDTGTGSASAVGDPPEWHHLYGAVLTQLRDVILPRTADGFAAQRLKGLARVVRHLEAIDLRGWDFVAAELTDLAEVLGTRPAMPAAGRRQLAIEVADGTVDPLDALRVVARRVARDGELLRSASGALADRHYDPLTRFAP